MVRNVSLIVRWQQRFCHATNQNKIRLSGKTYVAFEREYSRWRSPEPLARPQDLALLLLILQHSLQGSFQFYNFWRCRIKREIRREDPPCLLASTMSKNFRLSTLITRSN